MNKKPEERKTHNDGRHNGVIGRRNNERRMLLKIQRNKKLFESLENKKSWTHIARYACTWQNNGKWCQQRGIIAESSWHWSALVE